MEVGDYKRMAVQDVMSTNPGTLERKMTMFAPEATVWDPVMRVGGFSERNTVRGEREVRRFFTWLGNLPPVAVEIDNVFGEANKVVVEWTLKGGGPGREFSIPCANIYTFVDDKITGLRMHFDSAMFAEITHS